MIDMMRTMTRTKTNDETSFWGLHGASLPVGTQHAGLGLLEVVHDFVVAHLVPFYLGSTASIVEKDVIIGLDQNWKWCVIMTIK